MWTRVATRVTSQHSSGVRATMEDDAHKVDAVEHLSDVGTDGSSDVSWRGGGTAMHSGIVTLPVSLFCSGPPPSYASAT